ncbi:hypothetical protein EUTSA_v10026674mg [Eutrema salsugineum]|uniref:Uncharacterized protein n=1 Tax=Eutrema salsugineum TaxID=72664 RepID=V4MJ28_EUTSA|nr:hypothetical protein EUTSA_v10026674mg [Eutrema salsugineum]
MNARASMAQEKMSSEEPFMSLLSINRLLKNSLLIAVYVVTQTQSSGLRSSSSLMKDIWPARFWSHTSGLQTCDDIKNKQEGPFVLFSSFVSR